MDNQNFNNQVNPFQMQNPQPAKKKSKAVIIVIIAVLIAIIAAAGIVIVKILSENAEESERDRKPYSGGSYAVKSKKAAADSKALFIYDAVNTVLAELDEEGVDTNKIEYMSYSKGDDFIDVSGRLRGIDGEKVYKMVREYLNDVEKVDFVAKINKGMCFAVISTSDEEYWGTKPRFMTYDDYKKADSLFTLEEIMEKFEEKCGSEYGFEDFYR